MNETLKVEHKIYGEETKKTKTLLWKLELCDNKPRLMVSDNEGRSFFWVFKLSNNGKWTTNSRIVELYPTIFARKRDNISGRILCMWDEEAKGE